MKGLRSCDTTVTLTVSFTITTTFGSQRWLRTTGCTSLYCEYYKFRNHQNHRSSGRTGIQRKAASRQLICAAAKCDLVPNGNTFLAHNLQLARKTQSFLDKNTFSSKSWVVSTFGSRRRGWGRVVHDPTLESSLLSSPLCRLLCSSWRRAFIWMGICSPFWNPFGFRRESLSLPIGYNKNNSIIQSNKKWVWLSQT